MDGKRMSLLSPGLLPHAAAVLGAGAHLALGLGLGLVYFRGLWWNARLFASKGRAAMAVGLVLGRFVLLGGLLTLASLEGALPLLATALGVLIGRSVVMRRVMETAP
jgi:F1F0 ATPase subunit 2